MSTDHGPAPSRALRIATLGPAGTNHELVTRRYLARLGIERFEIVLVTDFGRAVDDLRAGRVDFLLQCAVHPAMPDTLGANFRDVFAVDCFIADSKELAIVTRRDVADPESIGVLLPANEKYTDLSRWRRRTSYPSLPILFEKLLEGEFDSALVYREFADRHPDAVRVDEVIGSPGDVWVVYGRPRVVDGAPVVWQDGPGARLIRETARRLAQDGPAAPVTPSQR